MGKTVKKLSMFFVIVALVMSFSISFMLFPSKAYGISTFSVTSSTSTVANGGTLQMVATETAGGGSATVSWSVATLVGGTATIDTSGLLTATGVGTVTVSATGKAPALYEGFTNTKIITITEAAASESRPLTPDEWVTQNLDMGQLVNHYGATSTGFLGMLYDNSMLRIPDAPGRNYWNEQLTGGVFGANFVTEHFIFSDELGGKVAAMSSEEYVSYLYTTLLSRNSDTDGYNNWLGYINSGFSKEETLRAFLNNEEWINKKRP
jgi:hypothetical protein